jgi:hypothetical protein
MRLAVFLPLFLATFASALPVCHAAITLLDVLIYIFLKVTEPAGAAVATNPDWRRGNSDWRRIVNPDWRRADVDERGNSDWRRSEAEARGNSDWRRSDMNVRVEARGNWRRDAALPERAALDSRGNSDWRRNEVDVRGNSDWEREENGAR